MMKRINKQNNVQAGLSRLKKVLSVLVLSVLVGGIEAKAAALTVSIADKIKAELSEVNRGKLVAVPSESGTYTFEWYRSKDGSSWDKIVRRKAATILGQDYYNVSKTGDWLDPSMDRLSSGVTDDSIRFSYKVKIATEEGSTISTEIISAPYKIPYYCALMNGDFENLLIPGNLYPYPWSGNASATNPGGKYWVSSDLTDAQIEANVKPKYGSYFVYERHEDELIWKTTDKFGCLEIINASPAKSVNSSTSATYNKGTYQNFVITNIFRGVTLGGGNGATFNGEQMAELNSESVATLYQDIMTIPGTELRWDIWHRARAVSGVGHIDEMRVLIMDSILAEMLLAEYPENPQEAVVYIINHPDEFPGALVSDKLSANVYKWTEHSGIYSVPEKQNLTRLFFVSESGNPGMGNLLDGVTFSSTMPQPEPHETVINIHKNISGVITDEQASNLKTNIEFSVKVGTENETVKGKDMFWQLTLDGEWVGNWTGRYNIDSGKSVPYAVEEKLSSSEVPPFSLDYTDSGNLNGNLADGLTYDIYINNNYKYPFDKIVIEKSGLKTGESAAFCVYDKTDPGKVVNVILTGIDDSGLTVSQKLAVEFSTTVITVKELPWSWAYEAQGDTEVTKDIITEGTVFKFANKENDKNPLHDEAIKNNSIINSREGVTVDEWEKEKRKL